MFDDFEWLLKDLKNRNTGIIFGKSKKAKEEALIFKKYASENNEITHVILDERRQWMIITDSSFQSVNKKWKDLGLPALKSYEG